MVTMTWSLGSLTEGVPAHFLALCPKQTLYDGNKYTCCQDLLRGLPQGRQGGAGLLAWPALPHLGQERLVQLWGRSQPRTDVLQLQHPALPSSDAVRGEQGLQDGAHMRLRADRCWLSPPSSPPSCTVRPGSGAGGVRGPCSHPLAVVRVRGSWFCRAACSGPSTGSLLVMPTVVPSGCSTLEEEHSLEDRTGLWSPSPNAKLALRVLSCSRGILLPAPLHLLVTRATPARGYLRPIPRRLSALPQARAPAAGTDTEKGRPTKNPCALQATLGIVTRCDILKT